MTSDGYESSGRPASDLAAPPTGPAPGARTQTDLDAVRALLERLTFEAKSLGIPRAYLHDIEAARAAINAIEKARTTS